MFSFFVRSGRIYLPGASGATFGFASVFGYEWSSRGLSTNNNGTTVSSGYNLRFNATDVIPSNGPDAYIYGIPLRCLSTVLDI